VSQFKTLMGVVSNRTLLNKTISIRARPAGKTRLRLCIIQLYVSRVCTSVFAQEVDGARTEGVLLNGVRFSDLMFFNPFLLSKNKKYF
jgi:hypothetical protein